MAHCKKCGHDVIQVSYAGTTLLLDPVPATFGAVAEHHIWPEDGDRVFKSTALVEHSVVCPRERLEHLHAQEAHRAASARQKGAKA